MARLIPLWKPGDVRTSVGLEQPYFKRIGIDGVGLLGGSLGLALQQHNLAETIIGIGRNQARLQRAKEQQIIHDYCVHDALNGPPWDILILAGPVDCMAACLERHCHAGLIAPSTTITDVGSTKHRLLQECKAVLGPLESRLVGSHPIAGSEKSGSDYAVATLFENRLTIVTPEDSCDEDAIVTVRRLWESVGCRIILMNPQEHDRILAASSHLPHLVAIALCVMVERLGPVGEQVIGSGFFDITRIASGNPEMWRDISIHNRDSLAETIDRLIDHLADVTGMIRQNDPNALLHYFQAGKEWRDRVVASVRDESK